MWQKDAQFILQKGGWAQGRNPVSDSLPELCWEKKKCVEKNVLYALLL